MGDRLASAEPHVLVVEDDTGTRALLARFLGENGFRATGARNGAEMWEALDGMAIDLILLDVMLPGASGLDLCRALRRTSAVPVIMLTARGSETDRVLGLELGADDYVPKPFSRAELLARIRAVLRRGRMAAGEAPGARTRRLRFASWVLDTARHELTAPDGAVVEISGAEYGFPAPWRCRASATACWNWRPTWARSPCGSSHRGRWGTRRSWAGPSRWRTAAS